MTAPYVRGGREGFTLLETLVALVVAGVIMTALAGPLLYVAQRQRTLSGEARRAASLAAEANRLMALPFADLDAEDGVCATDDAPPQPFTRCVDVQWVSNRRRDVTIVATPHDTEIAADTVVLNRARPRTNNPFNTGS